MRWLLISILFLSLLPTHAQNQTGKLGLEITKLKLGVQAGAYKGRIATANNSFNQGATFAGQAYFPFQLAADYRKNFTDSAITNEYNNRVFLIRPNAIFQYVNNGSMLFGLGAQFSFLITNQFYLEYQPSWVYVEATLTGAPDLYDGFHLHHLVSISKPLSRHYSLSINFAHLSGAGITSGNQSNIDALLLGLKWNL